VGFRNRYRAADGSYRLVEWTGHGSSSEGLLSAVGRDITVQREAEEQLANHAQILETKVAERTRELEDGRAKTLRMRPAGTDGSPPYTDLCLGLGTLISPVSRSFEHR
jgi:hypothetical protein